MMIEKRRNPWNAMAVETQRRVGGETIHDLYWARDAEGRFGFYVDTSDYYSDRAWQVSLRGIDVLKKPNTNGGRYFLILRKNSDWEIFFLLCEDLVGVAQTHLTGRRLIARMQARLYEWQRLLEQDSSSTLPFELQMGLFSELALLSDFLIPTVGMKPSVQGWGGPTADKQDFSFDRVVIEVKSYLSKKGPTVWISSLHQLWPQKENFYLVGYGLSVSDNGRTIKDVLDQIRNKIDANIELLDDLETKVAQYGYFATPQSDGLLSFLVDSVRFYRVTTDFPRISPEGVPFGIDSLKYSVDLGRCQAFERSPDDLKPYLI